MIEHGRRVCDICDEEIPKGQKFQRSRMPAEAAALLANTDPELTPAWTENADGTITMDICLTCVLSMGSGGEEPAN